MFSLAKIFIPVADEGHWGLIVATMQSLRGKKGSGSLMFKEFGSEADSTKQQLQLGMVKDWLQEEAANSGTPFDPAGWTLEVENTACSASDSGIFLIAFVEFVKLDLPMCFGLDDIDHFRYRFSLQLFTSIDK